MLILRPTSNQYRYNSILVSIRRDNPFSIFDYQLTFTVNEIHHLVSKSQFSEHRTAIRSSKCFDSCKCCLVFEQLSTVRQNKGVFIQYFTATVDRFRDYLVYIYGRRDKLHVRIDIHNISHVGPINFIF